MAPSSQKLEPPAIPGRFNPSGPVSRDAKSTITNTLITIEKVSGVKSKAIHYGDKVRLKTFNGRYLGVSYQPDRHKVYKYVDMHRLWTDRGSGAHFDVSIWRPNHGWKSGKRGWVALGDIGNASHGRPGGGAVVFWDDGKNFKHMTFTRRWADWGSGAHDDVSFWIPNCPSGYASLGHFVTPRQHDHDPRHLYHSGSNNPLRCIHRRYVTGAGRNKWTGASYLIWIDKGSGAHKDVTVINVDSAALYPLAFGRPFFNMVHNHTHHRADDWNWGMPFLNETFFKAFSLEAPPGRLRARPNAKDKRHIWTIHPTKKVAAKAPVKNGAVVSLKSFANKYLYDGDKGGWPNVKAGSAGAGEAWQLIAANPPGQVMVMERRCFKVRMGNRKVERCSMAPARRPR